MQATTDAQPTHHLHGFIDLSRYPLDDLDGDAGGALVEQCRRQLDVDGCVVLENFVPEAAIKRLERETERLSPEAHCGVKAMNKAQAQSCQAFT